jgi:exodeoxyribonuclease V alpha subunit
MARRPEDVRHAAAVLRALHACCETPQRLPQTAVLRLAALGLRLDLVDAIRDRDARRLAAAGVLPQYAAALFGCFPSKGDAERLRVGTDLVLLGLRACRVRRAVDAWAADAARRVERDPYGALFDLEGTVEEADRLAAGLGFDERVAGHARWLLRAARRDGHTALPTADVVPRVWAHARARDDSVTLDAVRGALARGVEQRRLVLVGRRGDEADEALAEPEVCAAEARIAEEVRRRAARSYVDAAALELADLRADDGAPLSAEQRAALATALAASVSIMTGGPGTGKSTVVRALVGALGEARCLLTAPTGRAARGIGGATVHSASGGRLLRRRPLQETCKADVEGVEMLVVDEASMLTTELMLGVLDLAPETCHILLVGDPDQLPPVGAGNVLVDLLASGAVPAARLTYNHRSVTAVQRCAAAVLEGRAPALLAEGVELAEARTPARGMQQVVRAVGGECGARQVLTPHNAQRHLLNRALQSVVRDVPVRAVDGALWGLQPRERGMLRTCAADGASTLRFPGADKTLRMPVDQALTVAASVADMLPGDAVMALKNQNKKRLRPGEVSACNGDVGELVHAAPKAVVRLAGGLTEFPKAEDWLTLAYAATVHKFQGSECDEVVLPVYAASMWDRQLLYTAITRARRRVVFVGTLEDLRQIVARTRPRRHSALAKLLAT